MDLKKELEEELKLNGDDIRSHAWYHGQLQREGAEELLQSDGDFLVRDSRSSAGDLVLSCTWKRQHMHFKIIRVVLRPKQGLSRVLFQFENDRFDNVPALVRFHVGGRRPVSHSSGAVISQPVNRTVPLRVITERQEARGAGTRGKRRSMSPAHTDSLQVNGNNLLRSGSQPANLEVVGRPSLQSAQSDSNLRPAEPPSTPLQDLATPPPSVFRTGSDPLLSPGPARSPAGGSTLRGSDGQLHSRAPPKPLRVSALFPETPWTTPRVQVDPSSLYDELVPQIPVSLRPKGPAARIRAQEKWASRARLTETSFTFLEAQRAAEAQEEERGRQAGEGDGRFVRPQVETASCFRLEGFRSLLLPENNRPLEQSALLRVKELLARTDATTAALHVLRADCQVARLVGVTEDQKKVMGVDSGLELITLPHGGQLRQDLLERHHLLALGVAVDVLGCSGPPGHRAALLHRVIQLAQALHTAVHDLYAFSAVMKALQMPQVVRLETTWRALRREHAESAAAYQETLRPFMEALNRGDEAALSGPLSLPHLVPLLRLMEGDDDDHGGRAEDGGDACSLLFHTLQSARHHAGHAHEYQRHAHALLSGGWEPLPELQEAFGTEFALRLFWGRAGAELGRRERYEKFDRILTLLSHKLEPPATSEL